MNCLECGRGHLEPSPVSLTGERHGEKFTVNMEGLRCPECGFETVDSDQSVELTRLISDAYRAAHGLLTGSQICERRANLGMSQEAFSEHLGAGVASVKRWETGKIQDRAMDKLIRLMTDAKVAGGNIRTSEFSASPSQAPAKRRKNGRKAYSMRRLKLNPGSAYHRTRRPFRGPVEKYEVALPSAVSSQAGYNSSLGSRTDAAIAARAGF